MLCFPGLGNKCFGRKSCVREAKMFLSPGKTIFLFSEQQTLFPQHMFPARLNWQTLASTTMFPQMFPSLARPLVEFL